MRRRAFAAIAALAVAGEPGVAAACASCFGNPDSPIAAAMKSGVFVLLGVTAVVLGWFATIILTIRQRTKRWEARKSALRVVDLARAAGASGAPGARQDLI